MSEPTKTILCVDDDADDLILLKQAIHKIDSGYQIIEANDGVQALDILHHMKDTNNLPCLIVLDINMPRMDGKQTLVEIQQHDTLSSIPVVMFTTSSSMLDKKFSDSKKVEMITKPINESNLITTARKFLNYCD